MALFIIFLNLAFANWKLPNPPESGIGDLGSFYLAEENDVVIHTMNNDFIGNTDKLMTGSMTLISFIPLDILKYPNGHTNDRGMSFSVNRKLITPILRTKFNSPQLTSPKGIHADWLEIKTSYSQLVDRWKFELSLSLDDLGNFDGPEIQSKIHQIIGSDDETSKYGDLKRGAFGGGSIGAGYLLDKNLLAMIYFQKNELMQDWEARASYVDHYDEIIYGIQSNLVFQQYSDLYSEITQVRYGWGFSVKYLWWQMNFGYISKYLKYDEHGQFYIDPLIITLKF